MNRLLLILMLAPALVLSACAKVVNYDSAEGPLYFSSTKGAPARSGDTLLVVTYNIELASKVDGAIADLSSSAMTDQADLVLLQEMDYPGVARIARELGYNFVYYPAVKRPENERDFGNAILSKWPITRPEKVILPHLKSTRNMQRIATFATVTVGDRELVCSSAHIEMFMMSRERRTEQVDSLSRAVPRDADHVIVAGDFNSFRGRTRELFDSVMADAGLFRATKSHRWTAAFGLFGTFRFKLDHIYLKGFRLIDSGVIYGTEGSDHRPVWAKVVWDDK